VEGAKDLWGGLGRICDIAELIRHHREMHWQYVMEQAEGLGAKRMLLLALYLAHDYLGAALPEEVLLWLQVDPVVKSLAAKIRQRLFPTDQDEPGLLERCLFQLRMRERLQDRIRYCFRLTLTPTLGDWQFLPLPESLSCFYYLVRPVRLACKYGGLAHR
jgi:hypothetical protein